MKNLSLVDKLIFAVNSVISLLLLLTYLAPYVSPAVFWPLAFFGLGYPVLLLLNVLFFFYWAFNFKRQILLPIITIGIGWSQFTNFIQIGTPEESENGIKVMSYNVRLFDLYNWSNNKQTRNKIFELIDDENPNILCLQEFFYSEKKGYFNTLDTLIEFQSAKNYHTSYTGTSKLEHHFGIATLSKYPIVKRGKVELTNSGNNICIFSDLLIKQDTIRVYNMHLASIHLAEENYKFIENINEEETDQQIDGSRKIVELLKNAFIKRAHQVQTIKAHIAQSPHPVIICGDFNDTPSSYAYQYLSNGLKDSFKGSCAGIGTTYNAMLSPFRIDYILHDLTLKSTGFKTISKELSDHFPVTASIHLEE